MASNCGRPSGACMVARDSLRAGLAHPATGKRDKNIPKRPRVRFMMYQLDGSSSSTGWKESALGHWLLALSKTKPKTLFRFYLFDPRQNFCPGDEFFVVGENIFLFDGHVLEEQQTSAGVDVEAAEQPHFVVQSRLFEAEVRTFMHSCQKPSERDGVNGFSFGFDPVIFLFVDPDSAFEFGKNIGMRLSGMKIFSRHGF